MRDIASHVSAIRGTGIPQIAYKVPEAAVQIGVSERQVWRWVQTGEIDSFKIGTGKSSPRRITHQALLDFVQKQVEMQPVATAS